MKHLVHSLILVLFCGIAPVYADGMPELPADNRIKILTYSPSDVFTVPTKYGYQTSIVFAHNEEIKTVSVGDRSMWQIIPSANRIFLRPMDDELSTNMTVITSIREYNFDIKSVAPEQKNNLYVVQFRYPETKENNSPDTLNDGEMPRIEPLRPALPPVTASSVNIPPLDTQRTQVLNENYTYTGPDELAPMQVYDDGRNTYVVYTAMPRPAPKPLIRGVSGKTATAKHKISGNKMTIYTVSKGMLLKHPKGEITVYNESFNP